MGFSLLSIVSGVFRVDELCGMSGVFVWMSGVFFISVDVTET